MKIRITIEQREKEYLRTFASLRCWQRVDDIFKMHGRDKKCITVMI